MTTVYETEISKTQYLDFRGIASLRAESSVWTYHPFSRTLFFSTSRLIIRFTFPSFREIKVISIQLVHYRRGRRATHTITPVDLKVLQDVRKLRYHITTMNWMMPLIRKNGHSYLVSCTKILFNVSERWKEQRHLFYVRPEKQSNCFTAFQFEIGQPPPAGGLNNLQKIIRRCDINLILIGSLTSLPVTLSRTTRIFN